MNIWSRVKFAHRPKLNAIADMMEWRRKGNGGASTGSGQTHGVRSTLQDSLSSSPLRKSRLKPPPGRDVPLELLSSPSRGLEGDGETSQNLTQLDTQEQFAAHISARISAHTQKHGALQRDATKLFPIRLPGDPIRHGAASLQGRTAALQSLQETLLLVRRLREGLVASARTDDFARRIYALSLVLSILIGDSIQLTASLGRLVQLLEGVHGAECHELPLLVEGEKGSISSDLIRSLLLLWLSVTGGRAERLGGSGKRQEAGSSPAFWTAMASHQTTQGTHVEFVVRAHKALASNDVHRIRAVLLESSSNFFHRALLNRVVEEKRDVSWNVLLKAYLHAAVDVSIIAKDASSWPTACGPSDWLERILLIDVELIPPSDQLVAETEAPDSWDDEVAELEAGMKRASLGSSLPFTQVRRKRLAAALKHYNLAEDLSKQADFAGACHELARWRGRISSQNGVAIIKLR